MIQPQGKEGDRNAMETMLIRERYKVVRVIARQSDYALLEAVDISDRETPSCLLNLYEGKLLRRYARICSGIRKEECPAFRGMFLERGTLVAVFSQSSGEPIDTQFRRGDSWSIDDRLLYTEKLLHCALSLANMPSEMSCAALLSDNVLIDPKEHRVSIRWMLMPMEEMNQRETALLATDQVRKIMPKTLRAGKEEWRFLNELESGLFRYVVSLYSRWREAEPAIREERTAFQRKSFVRRGLIMLGHVFRRKRKED